MIGNLTARRWRWNPFVSDQDFKLVGESIWARRVFLDGPYGAEHTGNFSCHLVINHNSHRHLNAKAVDINTLTWALAEDHNGVSYTNINFYVKMNSELLFCFDSK